MHQLPLNQTYFILHNDQPSVSYNHRSVRLYRLATIRYFEVKGELIGVFHKTDSASDFEVWSNIR